MMEQNTTLKVLHLTGANFAIGHICKGLNKTIETLDFYDNPITRAAMCVVVANLENNTTLKKICFRSCNISNSSAIVLLHGAKHVRCVDLSRNQIDEKILHMWKPTNNLRRLVLADCAIENFDSITEFNRTHDTFIET